MSETSPVIEVEALSRTFGGDHASGVHGVQLRISAGEFVAIVGPSGSGKSTLLNLLGLLDRPDSGEYRLDGRDTRDLSERDRDRIRSESFGFVFQSSYLLTDSTALENAALSLRVQSIPLARRNAEALDALQVLDVGEKATTTAGLLSGGERQRVAIARAIAHRPRVLFADEPTGNLDSANSALVVGHLRALSDSGVTVVLITHDPAIAGAADRIVEIVDGRVRTPNESSSTALTEAPGTAAVTAPPPRRVPREPLRPEPERASRRRLGVQAADDIADAMASLAARPGRTVLLLAAFMLGVAGLLMSVGLGESAAAQVSERLSAASLDEVRVQLPGDSRLFSRDDGRLQEWIADAAELPHVLTVAVTASAGATQAPVRRLSPSDEAPGTELLLATASPAYLTADGTVQAPTIGLSDSPAVERAAWLGAEAVAALGAAPAGPGSTIWVGNRRLDVIGLLEPTPRDPGLSKTVLVTPDVMASLPSASATLVIRTERGFPAAVADAIPLMLDPTNPGQFTVETVADLRALTFGVANDLGILLGALSAVLFILAILSASTTMYLSVQSRSSEIALRRAIGASRPALARMFLLEGLIIGLLGGAVGAAAGVLGAVLAASAQGWIPVLPEFVVPAALVAGAAAGLVSAAIPAISASRKDPAGLLRSS